jgi:hypothetical protein
MVKHRRMNGPLPHIYREVRKAYKGRRRLHDFGVTRRIAIAPEHCTRLDEIPVEQLLLIFSLDLFEKG